MSATVRRQYFSWKDKAKNTESSRLNRAIPSTSYQGMLYDLMDDKMTTMMVMMMLVCISSLQHGATCTAKRSLTGDVYR